MSFPWGRRKDGVFLLSMTTQQLFPALRAVCTIAFKALTRVDISCPEQTSLDDV